MKIVMMMMIMGMMYIIITIKGKKKSQIFFYLHSLFEDRQKEEMHIGLMMIARVVFSGSSHSSSNLT
jgi:hypothetical protein